MTEKAEPRALGRYRLLRQLGAGGMGEVHLAVAVGSAGFEKLVALKILGSAHSDEPGHLDSLKREALIGVGLDHENVVSVLDFDEADDAWFIAMEYVRGYSLDALVAHARHTGVPLPVAVAVHIVRTVANALRYVHELSDKDRAPLGLIHGDVSPSNVLLAADGRIKLSDFGIAALSREITGSGVIVGKPRYLPPEAFAGGQAASQRWDIYALGLVLYEVLASQAAYAGDTPATLKQAFVQGPTPLGKLRPDAPTILTELVDRAISRDPVLRFPSIPAFRVALDGAVPRKVDDADQYAALIERVYNDDAFTTEYGTLPASGRIGTTGDLAPYIASQTAKITVAATRSPPLKFGLSPALSSEIARRYGDRLGALLSKLLDRDVRTIVFGDYKTVIECVAQGEVDFAWMPPVAFVDAAARGAGVLTVMERAGRTNFESAIIVPADSKVEELEELRGQSMAWVDRASSSGYLFALAKILTALGADRTLGRQHFHGSHLSVCEAIANGWAAAGATFAIRNDEGKLVSSGWLDLLPERAQEIRALDFAGPIPADTIAHRPQLPGRDVEQLVETLSGLRQSEEGELLLHEVFRADALVRAEADIYDAVADAIAVIRATFAEA